MGKARAVPARGEIEPIIMVVSIPLLFFYIYNTPLHGLPQFLTSIRIVTVLSLILAIFVTFGRKQRFALPYGLVRKSFKRLFWLQVFLLIYVLVLIASIGMGDGTHIIANIINLFLFSFIPIVSFTIIFRNLKSFIYAIIWVTLLQTAAIWLCLIEPSFAQLVDYLFPPSEFAIEKDLREGYAGGIHCIAAQGVFKYSLGIIACLYYIIVEEKKKYYSLLFLFGFTSILVARTGLFIFASSFIVILYYNIHIKKTRIKSSSILLTLIISLLLVGIGYYSFNNKFIRDRLWRMEILFEVGAESVFFRPYFESSQTIIPELTTETMIGTGITYGRSGNGIDVVVDGGYLRLYVAYGLVMAIVFYLFLYSQMFMISRHAHSKSLRYLLLYFTIFIIVAEFKEFVIYDMYMLCIYYVMAFLSYKYQCSIYPPKEISTRDSNSYNHESC